MIEPGKLTSSDLNVALQDLEDSSIVELENMLISELLAKKSIRLHGRFEEVLEFAGRTNYKIRLRQPNKTVWSVSYKDCRESIRKVLRLGTPTIFGEGQISRTDKKDQLDHHTTLLLNILPEQEYEMRSFIGNPVVHPNWGIGRLTRINENGNIEVQFEDRTVRLKPDFIKLKLA
jgi:hypothetical protein